MPQPYRSVLAALMLTTLAACDAHPRYPIAPGQPLGEGGISVTPPRYPISPSTATPAAPPAPLDPPRGAASSEDADAPRAAPAAPVESRPLLAESYGATPPPTPPPAAPDRAALAPGEIQVQPFESVYDVAERAHTGVRDLIDANGLQPPYALAAGQVLRAPRPQTYIVVTGDTLFGVGRRFNLDPRALANQNNLPLEAGLQPGQRLALPAMARDAGRRAEAQGDRLGGGAFAGPSAPLAPRAALRPSPPERAASETPSAPAVPESEVAGLARGRFIWPVQGEIVSTFGPKGPGRRNDGVNIAAATGDTVKAAAAGVVVYAGNSIPAFGNLVLIKHPGGWATLYGNLGRITVVSNAAVVQGQAVGVAGLSGAVDRPQVHFEIRFAKDPRDKARPYDPAQLLPPQS
jgi:murein DD-endopeptidase MepM/ murein hydrolase activator NlpD